MTRHAPRFCGEIFYRDNNIEHCCFQIHQPFMIFTLLTTAVAFVIIFVAVEGYSDVSGYNVT